MDNPFQRPAGVECPEPQVRICVASNCGCLEPAAALAYQSQVGVANHSALARCQVTITYPQSRPTMPELYFSSGDCGVNAELALAVALAYFLKGSANTQIP